MMTKKINFLNTLMAVPAFFAAAAFFAVTGISALRWLRLFFPALPGLIFWIVLIVLFISIPISYMLPKGRLSVALHRIGEVWTWIFLYLAILVLLANILKLLWPGMPLRQSGFCVLAAMAAMFAYGVPNALHTRIKHYDITLDKPSNGLRIALISDLHMGVFTGRRLVRRIASQVNSLDADIILIAGDLFDEKFSGLRFPETAVRDFQSMKSRLGLWACWGNHDMLYPSDTERAVFLSHAGIRVLEDEQKDFGAFTLISRKDIRGAGRMDETTLLSGVNQTAPVIVLDHNPGRYKALWAAGADLVLSGHTHGGQSFPGNLIYKLTPIFGYGHKETDDRHVIVTSGAGYYGIPLRIGVNNEVVCIDIR